MDKAAKVELTRLAGTGKEGEASQDPKDVVSHDDRVSANQDQELNDSHGQ
jgi:hypothetical protein